MFVAGLNIYAVIAASPEIITAFAGSIAAILTRPALFIASAAVCCIGLDINTSGSTHRTAAVRITAAAAAIASIRTFVTARTTIVLVRFEIDANSGTLRQCRIGTGAIHIFAILTSTACIRTTAAVLGIIGNIDAFTVTYRSIAARSTFPVAAILTIGAFRRTIAAMSGIRLHIDTSPVAGIQSIDTDTFSIIAKLIITTLRIAVAAMFSIRLQIQTYAITGTQFRGCTNALSFPANQAIPAHRLTIAAMIRIRSCIHALIIAHDPGTFSDTFTILAYLSVFTLRRTTAAVIGS